MGNGVHLQPERSNKEQFTPRNYSNSTTDNLADQCRGTNLYITATKLVQSHEESTRRTLAVLAEHNHSRSFSSLAPERAQLQDKAAPWSVERLEEECRNLNLLSATLAKPIQQTNYGDLWSEKVDGWSDDAQKLFNWISIVVQQHYDHIHQLKRHLHEHSPNKGYGELIDDQIGMTWWFCELIDEKLREFETEHGGYRHNENTAVQKLLLVLVQLKIDLMTGQRLARVVETVG